MMKVLTAALLMTGAMAAHADGSLFTPFHADYDLEREGIGSAHSVFTLEQGADGSYSYKSAMHATGIPAMFFSDLNTETSPFTFRATKRPRPACRALYTTPMPPRPSSSSSS